MSLPGYDAWKLRSPDAPEATDDPGTKCLGSYPADVGTDAWQCEERTTCYLCGGVVCAEHDDDTTECEGQTVHLTCHKTGCRSPECDADARDDYLLDRAGL